MDLRVFATVFATVFVAELGDKTQLATLLYAADTRNPKITVFAAGAAALVLAVALAVPRFLSLAAGSGFVVIGVWTIVRGLLAA